MNDQNINLFDGLDFEDTQKDKYLIFKLDEDSYGIDIKYVVEIIGIQEITEVPDLPIYIRGIINLRGKVIPVMDMRIRLKKEEKDYNDRTCIIVIELENICLGIIVDSVSDVVTIGKEDITNPPNINNVRSNFIKSIGKIGTEVKLLLDCKRIIGEDVSGVFETDNMEEI